MREAIEFFTFDEARDFAKYIASRGTIPSTRITKNSVWEVVFDFDSNVEFNSWPQISFFENWNFKPYRSGKRITDEEENFIVSKYLEFSGIESISRTCGRTTSGIKAVLAKRGVYSPVDSAMSDLFDQFGDIQSAESIEVWSDGVDLFDNPPSRVIFERLNAEWVSDPYQLDKDSLAPYSWDILANYCQWGGNLGVAIHIHENILKNLNKAFYLALGDKSCVDILRVGKKMSFIDEQKNIILNFACEAAYTTLLIEIPSLFQCFRSGTTSERKDYKSSAPRFKPNAKLADLWYAAANWHTPFSVEQKILHACIKGDLKEIESYARSGSKIAAIVASDINRSLMWWNSEHPLDSASETDIISADYIPSENEIFNLVRQNLDR